MSSVDAHVEDGSLVQTTSAFERDRPVGSSPSSPTDTRSRTGSSTADEVTGPYMDRVLGTQPVPR